MGRNDLDLDSTPSGDTYFIKKIYVHPLYNRTINRYNDICLLKTHIAVAYRKNIWPICLPKGNDIFEHNDLLQVAGWGHNNKTSKTSILKGPFVRYINSERCESMYTNNAPGEIEKYYPNRITDQLICAGNREGVNACKGDSGGPLSHLNANDTRVLVGLVARGFDVCTTHLPVFYTNVTTYLNWIYSTTGLPRPAYINECQINNGGCSQTCSNSGGTFSCTCGPGYSLGSDSKSCNEIDICSPECQEEASKKFYEAARDGNLTIIISELSKLTHVKSGGLRINWRNNDERNRTALYIASRNGHTPVVSALLAAGADPEVKEDRYGQTTLYIASENGHAPVVSALLDAGADPEVKDRYGGTPVYVASLSGHARVLALLIGAGADVNTVNNDGESPLMQASGRGRLSVVQSLITAGARVGDVNSRGESALHWAAGYNQGDVARLLLDNGADKTLKDYRKGDTPADEARNQGHHSLAEMIDNY